MSDRDVQAMSSGLATGGAVAIQPRQLQDHAARLGVDLDARRAAELAVEVTHLLNAAMVASRVAEFEDEPAAFLTALAAGAGG